GMDPPAKEGSLLVQHSHKFGTKRWKRSWFVLYPASQHGVARLEFFDCKEPAAPPERLGTKRLDKTVVRLADCTSVAPVAESGPRAGTSVFRLETSDRSYLFAADKQQSEEWVAKLCEIAFPVSTREWSQAVGQSACTWDSGPLSIAPTVPAAGWVAGPLSILSVILGCSSKFQVRLFSAGVEPVLTPSRGLAGAG
uniref:Docking protein 1 n=1 Tax=Aquila chrysaetos chrysaetos TaxID=223781 RepID=A0A663FDH1_AQUCH